MKFKQAIILFTMISFAAFAQEVENVEFNVSAGLSITDISGSGISYSFSDTLPLFSLEINDQLVNTLSCEAAANHDSITFIFSNGISGTLKTEPDFSPGWKAHLTLTNLSDTSIKILNLVPLGQSDHHIYITASEPWNLASSKIFRPGLGSIGVVLPDNAWSLGYSAIKINDSLSVFALARRMSGNNTEFRRYSALMKPGGNVDYDIYIDCYKGSWQNGLRTVFQERYLYDLKSFDNKLFERKDLEWVRHSYLIALLFGWDRKFYDQDDRQYHLKEFLSSSDDLYGKYDIFCLWPTFPTLGMDPRNQWDLYSDLPGGLKKLKELSDYSKSIGTKFFISFNPWDQSTRKEDFYEGISRLIRSTDADGIVLDTYGSSSEDLQNAADSVREGVIMYSEGMAVPKDMPGIVSGRVHNAIFMPPPLNLNKLIKPEFAIFRVLTLDEGRLHRETAVSFFNGYGVEINMMAPARPPWMEEEFKYLGKALMILRENTSVFTNREWTPLINTLKDSIWINEWKGKNKKIYTIFSLIPEGFDGPLFKAESEENYHFVDLWNHNEIAPDTLQDGLYIPVRTDAFNRGYLGTRREGNAGCIAEFPVLLNIKMTGDELSFSSDSGDSILISAGSPSYGNNPIKYSPGKNVVKLREQFDIPEGRFVIQLFTKGELIDERIVLLDSGMPVLTGEIIPTKKSTEVPAGMIEIPRGRIRYKVETPDEFIAYPHYPDSIFVMHRFFMDKYPVTNKEFKKFIDATDYRPDDTTNFLKNWRNRDYPDGAADIPVVYVSIGDAKAYAEWAGKRLPSEMEWQYAAQCGDTLSWPWGSRFDSTKCNYSVNELSEVNAFPRGDNKWGVADLTGNARQLTNDVYDNGSYKFIIVRGGSYYNPTSSWWYVKGGPQPLNRTQMLLQVSPGFERNSTIGFRCVKDAVPAEENK